MIRVSVTDVDAFRYWKASEEMEVSELLARLRREALPTEQMAAGSALHKALEHAQDGDYSALEADGYKFVMAIDEALALPVCREVKAEKVYAIGGERVQLVGKVDAVDGLRVDDHKSTLRFDAERFMDSFQWRGYLSIFHASQFRWNVFEMAETGPATYRVFGFHQLEQYRYPGLERDVCAALSEFLSFARVHLPERFMQEAA